MVFNATMKTHGIPCRATLSDSHIFPEIYVKDCGWVPCEATMKDTSQLGRTDAAGHTVMVGAPHRLDISAITGTGGARGLTCPLIVLFYNHQILE